ncbi:MULTISPECIES: BlaI/MecI/CopY family transcriptional regulator [Pseudomonadota]|jgi:predicted transcriptional regulator|uniref:BlaI/MecI/CopY family transcriptional regulator n=2 Tax=Sphingomonadales TaxID=204457 RepID=A0A7V8RC64_9SPHN|nr:MULTISPECIES: BlaI/MecI/CopY family transcriptional regulator [Pseudomonadota]MAF61235.1 CopY family transcriptional repressor [Blastomonas sp.]OHC92114.1 MAG: CopY family transcriptional repressor [Sphingomonadales bacterium RIFCSPHIGHO2_01_FULL_65_20]MBA1373753.1 BlaI/MecI/CopY family transcriptional regulator [Sphingomonas ursincola]MBA4778090.1 BlaI/MecI/CopY family transcriptional regulator [Blastomonas sp.]MBL0965387.1 BlaI/MecI/CopY family transcriptional regulator [Blastomonas sp.]|tara:strand:+ start:5725 stop:6096 length:372 start_codon:yes stop_codon:yes gene_type:complete
MAPERISDAEHAVMEVLWQRAPLTATEVADALADAREWSLQTVKTLLSRLTNKGAVSYDQDGRRYLYSPILAREDYVGDESRRLVDRLFGGRAAPLIAHLAEQQKFTAEDLAEIERLIGELKS